MTSVASARYLKLCMILLLSSCLSISWSFGSGLSDTLWVANFDAAIPADWWSVATDPEVAWKRVGDPEPGVINAHLLLENAANSFENIAVLTTGIISVLPDDDPAYLSLDLDCSLDGEGSSLLIEAWNGTEWTVLLKQTERLTGQWVYPIDAQLHPGLKLRFTYQSEVHAIDQIQIDNILISRPTNSCGNGICEWGEDPNNCPTDCARLTGPGKYWVPLGEDLSGEPVSYRAFQGRTACDDCSERIELPFAFDFYGESYREVYLNANGNLTFDTELYEFTPGPFCLAGPKMIAPFFADVDLGRCGQIDYYLTDHYLLVTWSEVCHFRGTDTPTGLTNTFQLLLTDGSVAAIRGIPLPAGTTILAAYGDMQWTTGNASGGTNGLNGVAATVGLNAGDGERCYAYARFDHTGYDRVPTDSLHEASAGVDHLDYRYLTFNGQSAAPISTTTSLRLAGENSGEAQLLNWTTTTESILSLSLERATTDGVFTEVTQLNPAPTGSYLDPLPLVGENLYRLRMTLADGQMIWSNTLRLQWEEAVALQATVAPNPFSDQISLTFTATDPETPVLIRLVDVRGQVLLQESVQPDAAGNRLKWSTEALSAGLYFLSVQQGSHRLVQRVVRQ